MKILFQGGWKAGRDDERTRGPIRAYCESLAEHIVENNHQVVLTSNLDYDKLIAEKITIVAKKQNKRPADHLLFLLPDSVTEIPTGAKVKKFEATLRLTEIRTACIQQSDA